jgi:bifunctional non-homologous end joining protein LigD
LTRYFTYLEITHPVDRILVVDGAALVTGRMTAKVLVAGTVVHVDNRYLAVDAVASLPVDSCIIDGEAIVMDQSGLSIFDVLRYRQHDHAATLCAFDLLELDGADVRSRPIEERKQHLAWALRQTHPGIVINATYTGDGAVIYEHACAL